MKKATWITTNILTGVLLVYALLCTIPLDAAQYGTNFKFKDIKAMEEDGWSISHPEGVTLRADGIVLDGSNGVTAIGYGEDVPPNINEWKAGARCIWLGGKGHSWLNVQVDTQSHTYVYALDGGSAQFTLFRDNVKVIGVEGYKEEANAPVEIYLEKLGSNITISYNSKVIKTYRESSPSPVTGVAISSPPQSAALYTWAGAYIPEPSAEGPTGDTETATTNQPEETPTDLPPVEPNPAVPNPNEFNPDIDPIWVVYDSGDLINSGLGGSLITGIQYNPGSEFDFTTNVPDGEITEPPVPPAEISTNHTQPVWIVMLDGTFSMNTDKPQVDDTISFVTGNYLFNGVGQTQNVFIGDGTTQVQAAIQHEVHLFESGAIKPETPIEYNPWGDYTPSFYVTGSTHISGDLSNPMTGNSAVAVFTFTVTGANGQVVYQQKIQAVASEGKSLYDYWLQGSQDVNNYLQGVINSMK